MPAKSDARRARLVRLIHVGKGKLGLSDDAYATLLEGATGKSSTTEMTVAELEKVMRALRTAGFVPTGSGRGRSLSARPETVGGLTAEEVRYIKGMWALVARVKTESALNAFIKRLTGVDDIRFVPRRKRLAVIIPLRAMMKMSGYDPDGIPYEEG